MKIRRARPCDSDTIIKLLYQVQKVHSDARPDIFKESAKKYSSKELADIISDDMRPIFVAVDENDHVLGYAFCILEIICGSENLADRKTLYIDDLCVDETLRAQGIGRALYDHVLSFARENKCHSITLNVWNLNGSAMRFYEKCGLSPLKVTMEKLLQEA